MQSYALQCDGAGRAAGSRVAQPSAGTASSGLTDKLQDQRRRECATGDTGVVCEACILVHMVAGVPVASHSVLRRIDGRGKMQESYSAH